MSTKVGPGTHPASGAPLSADESDAPTRPAGRTRREWVILAISVVVLASLCLVAGRWQWNRHVSRDAQIEIVQANYEAAPVPLGELLPGPGAAVAPDDVWHPVTMHGTYRIEDTVLLRNRPVDGQAGFHVLVPFEADEPGVVIVVDRGFVPMGADSSAPEAVPEPVSGPVTVTARLRLDEAASAQGAPPEQVQAINTDAVLAASASGAGWAESRTVGAYAALMAEDPAPAQGLLSLPAPSTDPGSHLSYAFQWVIFALGAVGGFVVLLRRDRRERLERARAAEIAAGHDPAAHLPPDTPQDVTAWIAGDTVGPARRRRARPSDEELEDAELDEQHYSGR